jgi:hypothetical protein
MTENIYFLQTVDGKSYRHTTREKVNAMIEAGKAEWVGTDGDEETNIVAHYADRIEE